MVTMANPAHLSLSAPPAPGDAEALPAAGEAVVLRIPDAWCFRIERAAPPSGWTRSLRDRLRPGLFPMPLDKLWWDEEVDESGRWRVWAVPREHLEARIKGLGNPHWRDGLKARVCPASLWQAKGSLSAFPNLAPPGHRPRRIPWKKVRKALTLAIPPLAVACLALWGGLRLSHAKARQIQRTEDLRRTLASLEMQLDQEKNLARALARRGPSQDPPPWVADLDALTRLLPDDTRALDLQWRQGSIRVDLITPHPEAIRDILEASAEFQDVHFLGNLERRGEQSRLVLEFRPRRRP